VVPLELKAADFDAYAAERTRATAMTAPRSAVKRRLRSWAEEVAQRLAAEGIDLDVSATDEHPSSRNGHRVDAQSAFLFRSRTARRQMQHALGRAVLPDEERPELGHARIEVRLDASAVSLVLWLGGDARVDLEHAADVLAHHEEDVAALWDALPEDVSIAARASLSPRAPRAREMAPRDVARVAKQALESEVPLVIGVRVPRDEAIRGHALDWWDDLALALARILQALSWSADRATAFAAKEHDRPSRRGKRARPKAAPPPAPEPSPKQPIDPGAHVRALAGPFAGQAGVVQELDGKGGARVLFGTLNARVELRDLTIADKKRGRPVLSSSHRKPTT
jgi:hypothetical protein